MNKKQIADEEQGRVARRMGARLRLLRRGRNLTQAQLSQRSGIAAGYIGNIERAEANPSASVLIALAHALQAEVGELFPTLREIASANGADAGSGAEASTPGKEPMLPPSQSRWGRLEARREQERNKEYARQRRYLSSQPEGSELGPAVQSSQLKPASEGELRNSKSAHTRRERVGVGSGVGSTGETKKRSVKREGTLMGTTAVARLLGTDLTTVERKIRRGELVPTDYVDNRAAVFSREEILRHVEHLGRHSHVEGQRVEDIEIKQASEVRDT